MVTREIEVLMAETVLLVLAVCEDHLDCQVLLDSPALKATKDKLVSLDWMAQLVPPAFLVYRARRALL